MSVVLIATGSFVAVVLVVFATVMYFGWRRSRLDLAKAQQNLTVARAARRHRKPNDPQIDEDRHVQAIRQRILGGQG